ncbi:MAG: PH domain-containing protein, partial [Deltaproteobacteria bacterium]|nr:PH domain-containing protein [Deltaproteobacteria bacterium]
MAALIGLGVAVKATTSRLTITPDKIKRQGGLFDRRSLSWPTSNLARVRVVAGLSARALGVGVIFLEPKDESQTIRFWGVKKPKQIKA